MSRYLITHSLLSSWLYVLKEDPFEDATTERNAYEEFLQTLNRVPTATTSRMQFGIDFEDLVTGILVGEPTANYHWETKEKVLMSKVVPIVEHPWYKAAGRIAEIVRDGQLQFRAKKPVTIGNTHFLLYGRLDALKAGNVFDIKFSKNYDKGDYFKSTQHPVYLKIVPEARQFSYLVSNGSDVWTETYTREETPDIYPIISDFMEWITVQGLLSIYKEKWEAK